jgi:type II secretory pathway component GspD/PulD (secretin)
MGAQFPETPVMQIPIVVLAVTCALTSRSLRAQAGPKPTKPAPVSRPVSDARLAQADSITLRIVNTELRAAVQIVQQYLDKPVIFTGVGAGPQVTLEPPRPIARGDVPRLLRGLLDSQGYELVDDTLSGTYRARLKEQPRPAPVTMSQQNPVNEPARRQTTAPEPFVISLKHARAVDVAGTINALFGRTTGSQFGASNNRPPTLADELRVLQTSPTEPPLPQAIPGTVGRSAALTGDLTIVADSRGNSLLIRANRPDFELIQAAVQQIDVRPAQVLIEVLIVEARRDRSFALGVEASIGDTHVKGTENTKVGGDFTPGSTGLGDFTLRVMGAGGYDLNATIRAAAGRGDVKIVSRPVVLTANDEQAEVVVGSQRPFVQVSRSLPTDAGVRDQVVQYKDVGTKLTVRPTISIDGTVQLNVVQEVSNATTETAFDAPVISTRSIRTDLLVKDGQTIALGGLTDKQHDVQSAGIPILSSIPLLGGLFGRQSRNTTETELFIFLTPRVIRTDEDAQRLTDPMRKRADQVKP